MQLTVEQSEALAILNWYRDMGIDAALGAEAIDWRLRGDTRPASDFVWPSATVTRPPLAPPLATRSAAPSSTVPGAEPPARPPRPALVMTPPARAFASVPPDQATMAARSAAKQADSLAALEAIVGGFDGCGLKATAKTLCFSRGAAAARLMIIGEAPGRDEDLAGKPFVGRSGQLLDRMLAAIGLGEADVHITNTVYWRPPGNRPPTLEETEICRPFIERQVELVAPELILCLGGPAAKQILGAAEGIMRLRGKWRDVTIGGHSVRAMATLHPAYLLRAPAAKRLTWRDLLAIKAALAAPK